MTKSITVVINAEVPAGNMAGLSTGDEVNITPHTLTLEAELWDGLNEICRREQSSLHAVCSAVLKTMTPGQSLERGMRFFVFDYFRSAATNTGHIEAGHGHGAAYGGKTVH